MCVVFIVEDEPAVRITAERILKRAGYAVLTATCVGEALAVIESEQSFDLLFTDMNLGNRVQGGMEVAQRTTIKRPGLPMLCTSGGAITAEARRVFMEPHAFLPKPYSMAGLLNAVASLVRQPPNITTPALPALPQESATAIR